MRRDSGILLHLTSLPGGEGIGDLGPAAHQFVDWLVLAGQRWWQVLPCGEIGFGESPYQSISAYAGNTLLISLQALAADGLLDAAEFGEPADHGTKVNFSAVRAHKSRLLDLACDRFFERASSQQRSEFANFEADPAQHWLCDYARFVVLKSRFGTQPWTQWDQGFAQRDPMALGLFDDEEADALRKVRLQQHFFSKQWQALRDHAAEQGIQLLGDCPIYVAADSADLWCAPQLFDLEPDGSPRVVAGVPPDYFSATGQLWGNPLYLWEAMAADNFRWWRARMQHCASQFDLTRLDHFRGIEAYWEVPAADPDASSGCWRPGPGAALLTALANDVETLPLVAEDLGDLTQSVHDLRAQFELPGMRVLQFGFDGGEENPHVIENIGEDVLCYVGTHDNNTTLGWLAELDELKRREVLQQLNCEDEVSALMALLDMALNSNAEITILSMQDLLQLGASARFNTPGTVGDNWNWRLQADDLSFALAHSQAERCAAAYRQEPQPLNTTIPLFPATLLAGQSRVHKG